MKIAGVNKKWVCSVTHDNSADNASNKSNNAKIALFFASVT